MKRLLLFFAAILFFVPAKAQKVGLVFSGGGAKGLAHIGVLKALEENNIPIDYIVGTSMGGIVGGFYAAGYSPAEIEYIALSGDFQDWVSGRFESDYRYFFRKKPDNPSIITANLQIDKGFQARIRSNLVNDIPLNFALLELLAQASANARDDFNNLFVPFRCIVADVFSQKMIPVSKGSLVEAIRGTFTVPLVYRPVKVDGKYVFDGGLYNNFPVDVLKKDFSPDYIIGTNVSSKIFNDYPTENDEKLMNRYLLYMFLSKSDSTTIGKNGVYLQPDLSGYNAANFGPVEELIKKGYDAAMAEMPAIKKAISRRTSAVELKKRRKEFDNKNPKLTFSSVTATGVNSKQKKYIERVFKNDDKQITLLDIKESYYKLVANDNFETAYPRISYRPDKDTYDFEIQAQPQDNFKVDFGGVISTRPISNAFLGLQFNYLRNNSYTFNVNLYSGRFYESAQAAARMDMPTRIPVFLETDFNYNHWNYFNTSEIFLENVKPVFLEQSDRRISLKLGIPLRSNGKIETQAAYINFNHQYSPTNRFRTGDILDTDRFNGFMAGISLEKYTLNRRQYATGGLSFALDLNYYNGAENYIPGNILRNEVYFDQIRPEKVNHHWLRAKLSTEQYVLSRKFYSLGYLLEAVISNKPIFSTYNATILSAPAFYPLQDSKSLYLQNFRANNYGAFGIKNILRIRRNLDLRVEGYVFQPVEELELQEQHGTSFGNLFENRYYAATAGLVYQTPAGPVSLSFNHYDDDQKRYGVMFHIGFLLYNKRSFE